MGEQLVDVTITADDADWLAGFTRRLVEDKLAACGNLIPGVRSVYHWEGAIHDDRQSLVILHTRAALVPAIIERADADHPDTTPQVLAVPVLDAHPGYRQWVIDSTG
ncbi:divalent-cation tolerance protein CutA [Nocardia abscessus]|uniref:divalent-cation tolerance protein CutA n=1 Tax=Nocardia abscessus TaxID=120957 RepID=UPI002454CA40|nr:divalent-cation tolerance protein CutA [Nocardia abscessus]